MTIRILHTMFVLSICSINYLSASVSAEEKNISYSATLNTATDEEYPHNNAIGFRSKYENTYTHNLIVFNETAPETYDAMLLPGNAVSDTILVHGVNLLEMMPSIPEYVKGNAYLSYIAILNQEWNRIQVKFSKDNFSVKGNGNEKDIITRIDIANNCLAKGLWEVIAFATEDGNDKLYFQCWFDFPEQLYNELFLKRNGIAITAYDNMLKNYGTETSQKVDLSVLRLLNKEVGIKFENKNNELYPLKGERETKAKNIVWPTTYNSINDFLTDDAKFATFAAPGQYTRNDPRVTELGRLSNLQKVMLCSTTSTNIEQQKCSELQMYFTDASNTKITKLVIGGIDLNTLPVLHSDNMHKGWQRPMGIANHSFYNSITDINAVSSLQNPYYALLLDANDFWLDSHAVGIDGPLFFRDAENPEKVHLLILSFERHAFVGHYVFDIPKTVNG